MCIHPCLELRVYNHQINKSHVRASPAPTCMRENSESSVSKFSRRVILPAKHKHTLWWMSHLVGKPTNARKFNFEIFNGNLLLLAKIELPGNRTKIPFEMTEIWKCEVTQNTHTYTHIHTHTHTYTHTHTHIHTHTHTHSCTHTYTHTHAHTHTHTHTHKHTHTHRPSIGQSNFDTVYLTTAAAGVRSVFSSGGSNLIETKHSD